MRTREEQIALLEHILDIARKRKEAGETEWLEFKTNISESHSRWRIDFSHKDQFARNMVQIVVS